MEYENQKQHQDINKRENFKHKLKAMRLRLSKKREEFLKFCSNTSRMAQIEIEAEIKHKEKAVELSDSVLSVEVSFSQRTELKHVLKCSTLSRTSTPIFCEPTLRNISKKKRTSKVMICQKRAVKKVKISTTTTRTTTTKRVKCFDLRENNFHNYTSSPMAFDSTRMNSNMEKDYLSCYMSPQVTSCEFQDFGEFKVWYV